MMEDMLRARSSNGELNHLVLYADREKMDVLSILDETSGITPNRRTRKPRAPRASKKGGNQAKKGTSDMEAEKATAKSDDISITTNASKTSSTKPKDKDAEVSKVKIPSKKTGKKKNGSIAGLDVVETPKRTKAKKNNSFDQDETDKVEEHHETNKLLERTEDGVSDSEVTGTPKRVHFEPDNSFSQQAETLETANGCKGNGTSETSSTDTTSKKVKKKKGQSGASDVETVSSLSNIQKVKEGKKAAEETNRTTDQSEMPSKKVKNKKSKSVVEPVPNETPSKKVKAKKTEGPSEIDQETTSESVNPDSSSKKAKCKASERPSGTLESETPSKKSKAVKEAEVETPSKKPKLVPSDADLLQSDSTNGSSKKRKGKVAADGVEIEHDTPSETPVKSRSQAQTKDDAANGLGNEETSSQDLKSPKKRKRKVAAEGVEIQPDAPSETPVKSRSQAQTKDDAANGLGNEETSSQDLKTPSLKRKKHKREEACDVPATPEAKKDKVKNKNKEAGNAEDALQPPPPEEEAASVPVAMSQKKKKKKKEKEREEETVPDDPPVSAPVEEAAVHKKKKKFPKQKPLSSDEAHGLNST